MYVLYTPLLVSNNTGMAAWTNCFENTPQAQDVATIRCLEPLFTNAVRSIVALASVVLFAMLLIAGFNFLFSGGDQKKLEKAKGTISAAVVGLVVIVAAYLILRTIGAFTGLDLTIFRISVQ